MAPVGLARERRTRRSVEAGREHRGPRGDEGVAHVVQVARAIAQRGLDDDERAAACDATMQPRASSSACQLAGPRARAPRPARSAPGPRARGGDCPESSATPALRASTRTRSSTAPGPAACRSFAIASASPSASVSESTHVASTTPRSPAASSARTTPQVVAPRPAPMSSTGQRPALQAELPQCDELAHRRRALGHVAREREAQPRGPGVARAGPGRLRSLYEADSAATLAPSLLTSHVVGQPRASPRRPAPAASRPRGASRARVPSMAATITRVPPSSQAEPTQVAGAVILDPQGRVLLVRRARPPAAGSWSLPGGRLEPGETPEEAVVPRDPRGDGPAHARGRAARGGRDRGRRRALRHPRVPARGPGPDPCGPRRRRRRAR